MVAPHTQFLSFSSVACNASWPLHRSEHGCLGALPLHLSTRESSKASRCCFLASRPERARRLRVPAGTAGACPDVEHKPTAKPVQITVQAFLHSSTGYELLMLSTNPASSHTWIHSHSPLKRADHRQHSHSSHHPQDSVFLPAINKVTQVLQLSLHNQIWLAASTTIHIAAVPTWAKTPTAKVPSSRMHPPDSALPGSQHSDESGMWDTVRESSQGITPAHDLHKSSDSKLLQLVNRINEDFILQKIGAEIVGTFFLVFAGCGAVIVESNTQALSHVGVALAFAMVITVLVYALGHVSGCHINPAVSIGFASIGKIQWHCVPIYISAQLIGAITAGFALRLVFNPYGLTAHLGATLPGPSGSYRQSLVLEIITTFMLMFVAAGTTDPMAAPGFAGLALGSTVGLNALFTGPVSGTSMNPARSIGPAVAANFYKGLWIYILGPVIGAVAGAWAYQSLQLPSPNQNKRPDLPM